jgi:hypothetical protein
MKKIILYFIFITPLLMGQIKNTILENKFEKEVLNEIESIQTAHKFKSNNQIFNEFKPKFVGLDRNLRILCRIRLDDIHSKSKLIELGCEIKNETHNDIYVWIPIDKIEEVASLNEVLSIGSKGYFITNSIISAGVNLHRINLVNSTYGLTGSGVVVGVISDGMKYATVSQYNGELTYNLDAVDYTNDTTNYPGSEGTAMMEIIYDIAPNARLWFGGINNSDTPLDFASRVTHLKEQNCKIIVDDIGYVIGYSYFQENEISTAIRQFIYNNNGCYISAVGNQHGNVYSGSNYTVSTDKFINFNGVTDELTFTSIDTGYFQITFQWADDWYDPLDDYDLYAYDNYNNLVDSSSHHGSQFPPEEYVTIHATSPNSIYKIKIKWLSYTSAANNREIKIVLWGGKFNFPLATKEKEIMGHQITDEIIGTAATRVTDSLNVEYFSSYGPARVYASSGIINDIQQPKITAADSIDTFVGLNGNFYNPFSGTSAAAPHVAGIAALYFEMFPSDGYLDFKQAICSTSITMSDGGGPNNWKKGSGYGRIDAYSAIQYRYNQNFVTIIVNQKNQSDINVDSAFVWQSNKWNSFSVPDTFVLQKGSTWYFKSKQSIINGEKYHDWNGSLTDVTNHRAFTIPNQSGSFTANLISTENSIIIRQVIENLLDIGKVGFKDPWYIDTSDTKGPKNRGTIATARWHYHNSPFNPDYSTPFYNGYTYKGVFLNQGLDWQPPYYSVKADYLQTFNLSQTGRTHNFYFQGWSASPQGSAEFQNANALETPLVFKQDNATVQANYKGTQLSNNSLAYSKASQRKFIKTPDGVLHSVYESLNKVWYERSTDNGSTWFIVNNGQPLSNNDSKNPSLSFYGNEIYIVWQEKFGNNYKIQLAVFGNNNYNTSLFSTIAEETNLSYSIDANPLIAKAYNGRTLVVWKGYDTNCSPFGEVALRYTKGYASLNGIAFSQYCKIDNSDGNSINPSLATDFSYQNFPVNYHIAWEQNNQIRYCKLEENSQGVINQTGHSVISTGSSFMFHSSPSIIAIGTGARVCWLGYNDEDPPNATVVFKDPANSRFWSFGSNASRPNINKSNDNTYYAFAWSQNNSTIKFADNGLRGVYEIIGITGKDVQLSNGNGKTNMYANIFKATSQPYFFTMSNNLNHYYSIQKSNGLLVSNGRTGVLRKNNAEIYFALGDIRVDQQKVGFTECSPETEITDVNILNQYLESQPFEVTDNSGFEYTVQYGVVDTSLINGMFTQGEQVRFKVELVDNNTGELLGVYDDVIYDQNNHTDFENILYWVNTQGIGQRTVKLRLKVESNPGVEVSMVDRIDTESALGKSKRREMQYQGETLPKEFALEQNYPNPFNPSTVISWQSPVGGHQTLKIYDVLGNEVATLVDEYKEAGRYKIEFDASRLASGVYMYKLTAGNYVSSKKMMVVK